MSEINITIKSDDGKLRVYVGDQYVASQEHIIPKRPSRETPGERARTLWRSGYRCISRQYRIVARIDRPDWIHYMAQQHCSWDINQGLQWVLSLGLESAGDFYRSVHSKDKLEGIDWEIYKLIRNKPHAGGYEFHD